MLTLYSDGLASDELSGLILLYFEVSSLSASATSLKYSEPLVFTTVLNVSVPSVFVVPVGVNVGVSLNGL